MDDLCNVVVAVLMVNGTLTLYKLSQQEELEQLSVLELGKQYSFLNEHYYVNNVVLLSSAIDFR